MVESWHFKALTIPDRFYHDHHPRLMGGECHPLVSDLVKQQHLMHLLGHAAKTCEAPASMCFAPIHTISHDAPSAPSGVTNKEMLSKVATESLKDPSMMRDHVVPAWLRVLDDLHAGDSTKRNEIGIQMWRDFGVELRVPEETILRHQNAGSPTGCSWFKCPLYGKEVTTPLRKLMMCSACKKVCTNTPYTQLSIRSNFPIFRFNIVRSNVRNGRRRLSCVGVRYLILF